jgi:hypothetical protein
MMSALAVSGDFAEKRALSLWNKPLLRVWDTSSGSQPLSSSTRLLARDPKRSLDTWDSREKTLLNHIDAAKREPTPYITFTVNPEIASELARLRAVKRGDQHVTLINPRTRLRLGLPIVELSMEAKNYEFDQRYPESYLKDMWLCLWEVTSAEIVSTWAWTELKNDPKWYEKIVGPALRSFQAAGDLLAAADAEQTDGNDDESAQYSGEDDRATDELAKELARIGFSRVALD